MGFKAINILLFGKLNESTLFKLITPVFGIKGIDI